MSAHLQEAYHAIGIYEPHLMQIHFPREKGGLCHRRELLDQGLQAGFLKIRWGDDSVMKALPARPRQVLRWEHWLILGLCALFFLHGRRIPEGRAVLFKSSLSFSEALRGRK
jgi:hypothetical protein